MKIAWYKYSLFGEIWQHPKSAQRINYSYCYIDIAFGNKMEKVTNSANSSCSIRYCVTLGSSFPGYSRSDFHCSHHANITPGSPISGMDGNSSNSFRILWYSSLVVVILSIGNYCSCVYFVGVCIFDILCTGYFSLSAVGMAIFHN